MTSSSRTFKFTIFLLFSLVFTSFQLRAEEADILTPTPPTVVAGSYILQDFRSGKILAENNADVKLAPASLTKIMTVFVVFTEIRNGHLHLDDTATISQKAWSTGGSKMFVKVDDKVKIEDLLKGVIIQSGNDASVALAEHVAGDESTFAEMMNQYAQRLGMLNTHFVDSNGLPAENHYTTARDLATLTSALIKEFPEYYRWFSQQEFTYNNITQHNRNTLLSKDGSVDGVKTGFTDDAGYCLVASALRNDMRLISVVMNTKSAAARAAENQNLLNYGFRFFESHKLFQGKTALAEPRIWKGDEKNAALGLAEDLYVTIPRRQFEGVKSEIVVDPKIMAPIQEGAKLGSVKVTLQGEVLADKDLIALTTVPQGGIFRRAYDSVAMLLGKSDAK